MEENGNVCAVYAVYAVLPRADSLHGGYEPGAIHRLLSSDRYRVMREHPVFSDQPKDTRVAAQCKTQKNVIHVRDITDHAF